MSVEGFYRLAWWYDDDGSAPEIERRRLRDWLLPYDRLLRWMSEKVHGSWADFRAAHAWVMGGDEITAEPAWIAARELQDLGYVEFAWAEGGSWCVAPPVLTLLPSSGGLGYLTGARTRSLISAIKDCELDFFPDAPEQGRHGPHGVFLLLGSPTTAGSVAAELGITYTFAVAETLADTLPSVSSMLADAPAAPFPLGFEREQFSVEEMGWVACPVAAGGGEAPAGLYRFRTWGKVEHRLVTPMGGVVACSREAAIYEVLRWSEQQVLTYDSMARCLGVPVAARLPVLHARVATLSSGLLPRLVSREGRYGLRYDNVSDEVAAAIADSLAQGDLADA